MSTPHRNLYEGLVRVFSEWRVDREMLIESAQKLIDHSHADLVIANDLVDIEGEESYKGILIEPSEGHSIQTSEAEGRRAMALLLCDRLEEKLQEKEEETSLAHLHNSVTLLKWSLVRCDGLPILPSACLLSLKYK